MPKRILIDASHAEETRVVTLENGKVQEFDSETNIKQQLKGNIYLAKVTRVEPSLQAAFVEYGGGRHGFLPFSEIHPDYYNLPVADKKKLLDSIREEENPEYDDNEKESIAEISSQESNEISKDDSKKENIDNDSEIEESESKEKKPSSKKGKKRSAIAAKTSSKVEVITDYDSENDSPIEVETMSVEEEAEEDAKKDSSRVSQNLHLLYKIQEVVKRGQVILIQVEKEERGNKGASLTTFLSLAGKYSVLMPNALRKGGVSRRISSYEDRKRLKKIIASFDLPKETGLIIRTAGAAKSEADIRRDYDYLVGLWNTIRTKTLESDAPAFIHAEEDLVKRIMRDSFNETIDEVLIDGKDTFKSAKQFVDLLMPEHSSKVKRYQNKVPIFTRYRIDEQISSLYHHEAFLQSGGSIVLNPTEALISIDVNSGRATNQRNVEETALATNLEAAYEVARQLKLRDMSGLIVIDFIDMMELKNRKAVEHAVKDAFRNDRARIQLGRISMFGLLEMSRQRLRPNFYEVNTMPCPNCDGSGYVKASETIAVAILRSIESDISRSNLQETVDVYVSPDVATFILNYKRDKLEKIQKQFKTKLLVFPDHTLGAEDYNITNITAKKQEKLSEDFKDNQSSKSNKKNIIPDVASNDDKPKSDNKKIGISSILEGLWKKIVD